MTAGAIEPGGASLIDHVAHDPTMAETGVRILSNTQELEGELTDHLDVLVDLEARFTAGTNRSTAREFRAVSPAT